MLKKQFVKTGQALVEFALAATLIFFLLAAAVDLGLIFFAIQGLHNAAQEGAAYGSRWLTGNNPRVLNENAIRDRVRHESGSQGGIGFVNLLDLNNDRIRDVGPNDSSVVGATGTTYQMMPDGVTRVIDNFIQIQLLVDTNTNGDPMDDLVGGQPTVCTDPADPALPCYIRVTVRMNYNTIFPLAPAFTRPTTLSSSYIVRIRDTFSSSGTAQTPVVFSTVTLVPTSTPTRTPVPLVVTIQKYWLANGSGSRAINITAKVTQGGVNVTNATVTASIGSQNVTLTGNGTGTYSSCGAVTGSSLPNVTVNATFNGASGSASTSSATGSTSCP